MKINSVSMNKCLLATMSSKWFEVLFNNVPQDISWISIVTVIIDYFFSKWYIQNNKWLFPFHVRFMEILTSPQNYRTNVHISNIGFTAWICVQYKVAINLLKLK